MLAKHRLEDDSLQIIRIFRITDKIPVDTQPVHIMIPENLSFTNYRNIVFSMTGYHTGATSVATIHVDRHAPFESRLYMIGRKSYWIVRPNLGNVKPGYFNWKRNSRPESKMLHYP